MKMTDEQRQFAEDNHDLIYSFLHKYNLPLNAMEDYYGLAAIGFCKAVITFDKEQGNTFSTYAYYCMLNQVRWDKRLVKNKLQLTSYEDIPDAEKWFIKDFRDMIREKDFNLSVQKYLTKFDDRTQLIVKHWLYGRKTFDEISKMVGVSRQRTQAIWKKFIEKARTDHILF